jgi:hypothetical protein
MPSNIYNATLVELPCDQAWSEVRGTSAIGTFQKFVQSMLVRVIIILLRHLLACLMMGRTPGCPVVPSNVLTDC